MGKPIKIKLLPNKKGVLNKQQIPGYLDLYILMDNVHFKNINNALNEEPIYTDNLEFDLHKMKESLNNIYKEEGSLNVLINCLETIVKSIKKQYFNSQKPVLAESHVEDFNMILEELDYADVDKTIDLDFKLFKDHPEKFIADIEEKLKLINNRKMFLNNESDIVFHCMIKLDIKKENINSSNIDVTTLEIASKYFTVK